MMKVKRRRRPRALDRGRVRRKGPRPRRLHQSRHRVPVREPADGTVLRRGRRAGRHARDPLRVDRARRAIGPPPASCRCSVRCPGPTRPPRCRSRCPRRVWIYEVDRAARTVTLPGEDTATRSSICRSIRCTGRWASPLRTSRRGSSLVPDAHGGNMDTPEMRAGVTCYLGVNVEGALFSLGDGHAARARARPAAWRSRRRWTR